MRSLVGLFIAMSLHAWTPAHAQTAGQTLWQDVRVGMTKDQFKAAYPKGTVKLANGCIAFVRAGFERNAVEAVRLSGERFGPSTCPKDMLDSLLQKYGRPRSTSVDLVTDECTYVRCNVERNKRLFELRKVTADIHDRVEKWTWFTGDTLVTFRWDTTLENWAVDYQPATIRKAAITTGL